MEFLKNFIKSKAGKRALWTLLNSIMALLVAFIAYLASENVTFAVTILPLAQAFSQFITKYLNS